MSKMGKKDNQKAEQEMEQDTETMDGKTMSEERENKESVDQTEENSAEGDDNTSCREEQTSGEEDEATNAKYLRLAADFQNYKRRVEKEKSDIYSFANEKIIVDLLDVMDNFERSLQHKIEGAESYAEGMDKIFKQLKGVLEKNGVEEIKAEGEEFDPNFHHAVMTENSVEYESGKVTLVLQKGYTLNSKVIRPSMVKVAE